jgi:hypothetical protein
LNGANEAEALAPERLDKPLLLTGVTDGTSDGIDARRQRSIRNGAAVPDGADQVVLAGDVLSVSDKVREQVEDLWRERDVLGTATQLAPVRV